MEEMLNKYEEKFGECFPLMLCRHMDDEEITRTVKECIDKNKPYEPDLDSNADY